MNAMDLSEKLGRIFTTLLGRSWRILYTGPPGRLRRGRARGMNVLFSFWHGRQFPLIFTHRYEGITVLVSMNRDGQYITNILHGMGFPTVRGSTSRGGLQAVRSLSRILRSGTDCAITPDGPRGPAGVPKSGLGQIARLGRVPVVPMGTSGWPSFRTSSWDGFMLALPFARMTVTEGRPLYPDPGGGQERFLERVRAETDRVTAVADLLASPGARSLALAFRLAGRLLAVPASLALLARPAPERRERRGFTAAAAHRPVWLHGSSMGEIRGLLPLAGHLESRGMPVHLTCFTPSGRKLIEEGGYPGSFLPLDSPGWVDRFLGRLKPRALVLSETELWPNLLHAVAVAGVPSVMANARLSERSTRRYMASRALSRRLLACFSAILCRTGDDAARFERLGAPAGIIRVSGDSKHLTPVPDPDPAWREGLAASGMRVLVAGSTREGEEEAVLEACRDSGWLPVLAPRHLDRLAEVMSLAQRMGFQPVAWSSLFGDGAPERYGAVVLDVHGILPAVYGAGDAAFVGGTIAPIGGHNVLEPLKHGIPVLVGEHHGSFAAEVDRATGMGAAFVVRGSAEMAGVLRGLARRTVDAEIASGRAGAVLPGSFLEDWIEALDRAGILTGEAHGIR
jgi:3-deoxy-D-manno-octulosonic-acid transferase